MTGDLFSEDEPPKRVVGPPAPQRALPMVFFNVKTLKWSNIGPEHYAYWKVVGPHIKTDEDVQRALQRAGDWLLANWGTSKQPRNLNRFLLNWMRNERLEQSRPFKPRPEGSGRPGSPKKAKPEPTHEELYREGNPRDIRFKS